MALRPSVLAVLVGTCLAAPLSAQECLGLHRPTGRRTLEMTSAYARDGLSGPTTLSLGTAGRRWWVLGEVGSDPAEGRAAPTIDAVAGSLGLRGAFGPMTVCGGVSLAKETLGGQSSHSSSLIFGGAFQLPVRFNPSLYGVGRYEVVEYDAANVVGAAATGFGVRVGLASYPVSWFGIRGYGDFSGTTRQFGMSLSLAVPTRRVARVVAEVDPDVETETAVAGPVVDTVVSEPVPMDADGDGVFDDRDLCPRTPSGTAVDGKGCTLPPADADGDGVPDVTDLCPDTPKGTPVTSRGCPADSDDDGVIDAVDACPNTPTRAIIDATGCPRVKLKLVLVGVNFRKGSAQLLAESMGPLNDVAAALRADQGAIVEIAGHTDDDGSPERNLRLSLQRARTVRSYLMARGVQGDRMLARGYGDTRPVATNATPEGQARNRRVEMSRID